MSVTKDDVNEMSAYEAAIRLVDGAVLQPSGSGDPVYQALVLRYNDDLQMQSCVAEVARAKDIRILSCEPPYGLLYVAEKDCRFALTLSKIPRWSSAPPVVRAAVGVGIPFVAASFFPTSDTVEDPANQPPPRSALEVTQLFVDACRTLGPKAPEDDEQVAEELWRGILDLPEVTPDGSDRKRVRRLETVEDVITFAIGLMVEWGYLKYMSAEDKRVYPTRKLQAAMRESIVPHFYNVARTYAQTAQESRP